MIIKKIRPLWSYKINKTERWLEHLAQQGWHLIRVNRWTRTFTFRKGETKQVNYRIQYDPKGNSLASTLQKEGWSLAASEGNWLFLINEEPTISIYPTRDTILKRIRIHAYVFSAFALFQLATHIPIILITIVSLSMEDGTFFIDDGLWVLLVLLVEWLILGGLAVYIFRAYRQFEIQEMDASIDKISFGEKVRKFKPGWMYQLEETRMWLEQLAREGYELEKVYASVFTFRKINPSNIKYECVFEYKVQPSFFTTHKEFGWQLKFSSNITLLNYSIWAMHYNTDDEVPQLSYNKEEQRAAIKRAFKMNVGMSLYLIFILVFSLSTNIKVLDVPFASWSFGGVLRPLLLVLLVFWIYKLVQILLSYRKSMRAF